MNCEKLVGGDSEACGKSASASFLDSAGERHWFCPEHCRESSPYEGEPTMPCDMLVGSKGNEAGRCGKPASVVHVNPVGEKHYWCDSHRRTFYPTKSEARADAGKIIRAWKSRAKKTRSNTSRYAVYILIGALAASLQSFGLLSLNLIIPIGLLVILVVLLLNRFRRSFDKAQDALRLQMSMMHRVLLDGLKPEAWARLSAGIDNYYDSKVLKKDWEFASNFLESVRGPSLWSVAPRVQTLREEAFENWQLTKKIDQLIQREQTAGPLQQKELWEQVAKAVCQCKEVDSDPTKPDGTDEVGQRDVIVWFEDYVTGPLRARRKELQTKLEDLVFKDVHNYGS